MGAQGATAMLARLGADARHTRDIDLLSRAGDLDESERALRGAAGLDLDDYFTFTLNPGRRIAQGAGAVRVDVVASLGLDQFASFHVGATELGVALKSEANRRSLTLPDHLTAPTGGDWPSGYSRVARDAPQLKERDLASAVETVARFIDPALAGTVRGQWDPATLRWHDADAAAMES
jgi:Nucleotidyl transferase AbiEii toxin, Type IV TA system